MSGEPRPARAALRLSASLVLPVFAGLFAFHRASQSLAVDAASPVEGLLCARATDRLPGVAGDPAWSDARDSIIRTTGRPSHGTTRPGADVEVRSLVANGEVAFRLVWRDETENRAQDSLPPDAVAIQLPIDVGPGDVLPSVFLGEPTRPVRLWIWSAATGVQEVVATGPASFQASQPVATTRVRGQGAWAVGLWGVVLVGRWNAAAHPDGPAPFAVYVWDGGIGEKDLDASLSGWHGWVEEDTVPLGALARGLAAGLGVLLLEWALVVARRPRC